MVVASALFFRLKKIEAIKHCQKVGWAREVALPGVDSMPELPSLAKGEESSKLQEMSEDVRKLILQMGKQFAN